MNKKTIRSISILVVVMALFMSACGSGNPFKANDKVTVQLAWFHQIEYTGFYIAAEKGFYADENIDVTLTAGGYDTNPIAEVTEGRAQFGISRGVNMVIAKSEGQDLQAVATIFRKSPWVAVSLQEAGIVAPEDMAGKTIGIETGDPNYIENIQLAAMFKKLNVDTSTITYVARDFADPIANDLQTNLTDADAGLFSTNDLVTAQMRGLNVNTIYYSDYGIDFYANLIFTNRSFLQENPDLTQRFMRATLRGYQYALENPDEAVEATLKYEPTLDTAVQAAQMTAQIPLIDTGDNPIGWMDENVWQSTVDILLEGGFIPSAVDTKSLYTNDFIK